MTEAEFSFTVKVDRQTLIEWNTYQSMFSGFDLTPEQMWDILGDDRDLVIKALSLGFETGEREQFMSLLSKRLIDKEWPTYGDGNSSQFFVALSAAADAAGYRRV